MAQLVHTPPVSLDGLHKLAPMGYIPKPPPMVEVHHTAPPISVAEDSTFAAWMSLPEEDHRTIEEYASNPVRTLVTMEFARPMTPPPAPPSRPIGPPNRSTNSTGAR